MSISPCYLFKNALVYLPIEKIRSVPKRTRGLYVLYKEADENMDVVYVGMARGERSGMQGRLLSHKRSKKGLWSHFSVFEVWNNISETQVEELEGLFRHIYRHDAKANMLNKQKTHKPIQAITRKDISKWVR